MQPINLKEKHISTGIFQSIFPLSLKASASRTVIEYLQEVNFTLFQLDNLDMENAFYGGFRLNHSHIAQYFLPLTANILFPNAQLDKGFQRYSKNINVEGRFIREQAIIPFTIHSIDIIACPFSVAFLSIRTEIRNISFTQAIEFTDFLRKIKGKTPNVEISFDGSAYPSIISFLVNRFCPKLPSFYNNDEVLFLERENMFVHSLLSTKDSDPIELVDLYRFGNLCGYDSTGKPYVNTNNLEFISKSLHEWTYDRFAPTTNYLIQQDCLVGLTTTEIMSDECSKTQRFYGFYYYAVLLSLFHKTVLLKISYSYSVIHIEQDKQKIESLLYQVNSFMSNYFYTFYPITSEGQEIFQLIRKGFGIEQLYANTKEILFSLVKYEDNNVAKKDSLLLLVLTLYTVICGIFSMNLFTHDLQGNIKWDHFKSYNPFEYFAVFIVFSGMIVVFTLAIQGLTQEINNRKNRKKWVRKTVWSSKRKL
ncbi:hypothetical protein V7266_08255 [Neobacillus drentensis]|uniref:hypothetical protein n=1 Tax=Neobacillus drentensis TaxID=220684 RepID=UPI002FFD8CDB